MHSDILGWAAAALMVATFSCREARLLRPLAVATNFAFIGYGLMAGLAPVLALHLLLLPINLWRWAQACGLGAKQVGEIVERGGRVLCTFALTSLPLLAGCGGGGEDSSAAAPPVNGPTAPVPAATIGTAGGMVTHSDGVEIAVPAGALGQDTPIEVTASPAGAPALPAGLVALSQVYAFTPHGATFAVPATVTVPFDPALMPAGEAPVLYKADTTGPAAGLWRPLADAVVVGNAMRASIDSFSHAVVAPPALQLTGLRRHWLFEKLLQNGDLEQVLPPGRSGWTELEARLVLTGPQAGGRLWGNASGSQYEVEAGSPQLLSASDPLGPVGVRTWFNQWQTFVKAADEASLDFTITKVLAAAWDYDPRPLECARDGLGCKDLHAELTVEVTASLADTGEVFFHRAGRVFIHGSHHGWHHGVYSKSENPLWVESDFEATGISRNGFDVLISYVGQGSPGQAPRLKVDVPLNSLRVGQRFTLHARVLAEGLDRRQSESNAFARFRDPQRLGDGVQVRYQGVLPIGGDERLPQMPPPPPACANAEAEAGTLQFESARLTAEERAAPSTWVIITRSGGTKGRVGATVVTRGGTAAAGDDYDAVSAYVGFADGEGGSRIVEIPVRADSAPETDETIELELVDPRGCAALGATARATLTILDDDSVAPPANYRVGGSVSGLAGSGLVLEDRAQFVDLPIAADGSFEINRNYTSGAAYDVRVKSPPLSPAQVCTVTRGSGVVGSANVTDIEVNCTTPLPPSGLDPSFGALGKMVDGLPGGARAIAHQSTGHILATNGASLVRYHPDGRLDTGFGGGIGKVDNLLTGTGADVADLAVASDDRIVVAGRILQPGRSVPFYQMAAARFNADGTRDTSFGSAGQAIVRLAGVAENATRVLVQPDGRVLLVGQATFERGPFRQADNDIVVVRLAADGAVDAGFGSNGATLADAYRSDFAFAAALQPDGRIFVAGRTRADNAPAEDTLFTRLAADGAIEPGFGRNPAYSQNFDEAVDVALQPDGKLVLLVAGRGTHAEILLVRLNPDGSLDTGFANNGLARSDVGPHDDLPRAVALQLDGKIVVAGQVSNPLPVPPSFAVLRYGSDGQPDTGFGTGGVLRVPFFGGMDSANDLLVQPDGRIVVAGSRRSGINAGIALIRLIP